MRAASPPSGAPFAVPCSGLVAGGPMSLVDQAMADVLRAMDHATRLDRDGWRSLNARMEFIREQTTTEGGVQPDPNESLRVPVPRPSPTDGEVLLPGGVETVGEARARHGMQPLPPPRPPMMVRR